jgi:hypothetical protein
MSPGVTLSVSETGMMNQIRIGMDLAHTDTRVLETLGSVRLILATAKEQLQACLKEYAMWSGLCRSVAR